MNVPSKKKRKKKTNHSQFGQLGVLLGVPVLLLAVAYGTDAHEHRDIGVFAEPHDKFRLANFHAAIEISHSVADIAGSAGRK